MSNPTESNPSLGPLLPLYDNVGLQTNIAARAKNVSTDANGVVSGDLGVDVEVNVTIPAAQAGIVALTSPPTATNAGSNTVLTFSSQINQVRVQNNTSANVYYDYDTPATLGSRVLAPGYYLVDAKKLTTLNLYTVAAQNINGSAVGAIVVLGEL